MVEAQEHLQYTGSRESKVVNAGIAIRTWRKWKAAKEVQQAEARLKHKVLLWSVAQGSVGLGSSTSTQEAGAVARGGAHCSGGRVSK